MNSKSESKIHNQRVLLKLLGLIMSIILSSGFFSQAKAAELQINNPTISGNILLPDGEKAGKGGISLTITASPRELKGGPPPNNEGRSFQTSVIIPEGKNSAAYSINVSLPPKGFGFLVNYIVNDKTHIQYRDRGFYSNLFQGQSVCFPFASCCDIRSNGRCSGIDIIITKLRTIAGNIVLPQGRTAPKGGLKIKLIVLYGKDINVEQINEDEYSSLECIIPEGKSTAKFQFSNIDPNNRYIGWFEEIGDLNIQGYRLMYRIINTPGYKQSGFFTAKGTVEGYNEAEIINVTDRDRTGINFILISALDIKKVVPVTSIKLDKKTLTMKVNEAAKLIASILPADATDKTVIWISSNKNIAVIDLNGKITAKKPGKTIITVKTKDGNKAATCVITVLN